MILSKDNRSVTIVGAGLAGLAATLDLHRAGIQTTVLEARNRVGGRVITVRDFREGQVAEGGGEFIEDFHHRMIELADEFRLKLEPLGGMADWDAYLHMDGKTGWATDAALWGADISAEVDKIWFAMSELGKQVLDPENPQTSPGAISLDQQSVASWLEALDVHSLAKKVYAARVRSEYTVEPEALSLLDLARWGRFYYGDPYKARNAFRIKDGNDQLLIAMARVLPDVRLSCPVTAVREREGKVEVVYHTAEGVEKTLQSDFVIIAIPFGPLKAIAFEPPLPVIIQHAMAEVNYGVVTKVMIQYNRRLSELGWGAFVMTDLPITCAWHPTLKQAGDCDIVTIYTGGNPGEAFSAMSDAERIQTAIAQIDQVCPGSAQYVVEARTIAWKNEPFSQGSYVAWGLGEVMAFWELLRHPAGRVYFAGEHIASHQGYMEGAVESGQRAAMEVHRAMEFMGR